MVDELRIYDQGVVDKFALQYDGVLIPQTFVGSPRPFSTLKDKWKKEGVRPEVPVMAVSRLSFDTDPQSFYYNTRWILEYPTVERDHVRMSEIPPAPVIISYQVDVWAKTRRVLNSVERDIRCLFYGDTTYIDVILHEWGSKRFSLVLSSLSSESVMEPGEGVTEYRVSASCNLKAVFTYPSLIKKTVLTSVIEEQVLEKTDSW